MALFLSSNFLGVLFKELNVKVKINLAVQAVGMLMGTSTHLIWVLNKGFLSTHYNAPFASKLFWDSLTFLDPIAALLLVFKPKAGIYLALIIMLVDVIHNNIFYWEELYLNAPPLSEWFMKYWMILGQIIFAVFVVASFKSNHKEIKRCLNS